MSAQLNERVITVDGHFGTLRFIGTIPSWGDKVCAYGIDWDQADRGKNDGSLNGVQYFQTQYPTSGSFIKSDSKKLDHHRSTFVQALKRQYSGSERDQGNVGELKEIHFGSKTTESYGFGKLGKIQSDFRNLGVVSLQRKNISAACEEIEELQVLSAELQNLHTLDLGYNLLTNINEVWKIIENLPNLKELVLNGNRFGEDPDRMDVDRTALHSNLKELHLIDTFVSIRELQDILVRFPNLEVLSLSSNRYTDKDFDGLGARTLFPSSLRSVDLSFNHLTRMPSLVTNIEVVNLSDNSIGKVSIVNSTIKVLDLRNNDIHEWGQIDRIHSSFAHLKELRINGNPLLNDLSLDEMTINLIARIECSSSQTSTRGVCKLNGVYLNDNEIENAELYFISKVKQGSYKCDLEGDRWQQLAQKYNVLHFHTVEASNETPLKSKLLPLAVIKDGKRILERNFLRTNSVLKVKGIIGKELRVSVLKVQLKYYVAEEEEGEEGEEEEAGETGTAGVSNRFSSRLERCMDDNFALIDSYDLRTNQNIYVSVE